jgi:hypothetical protein
VFEIVKEIVFQSIFYSEIYHNNIYFYFLKFIFDINTSKQFKYTKKINLKKFSFFKNIIKPRKQILLGNISE